MTAIPQHVEQGMSLQFKAMFEGKEGTADMYPPFLVIATMMQLGMSQDAIGDMYKYLVDKGYSRDKIDSDLVIAGLL